MEKPQSLIADIAGEQNEMRMAQQKCQGLFNPPPNNRLKRAEVAFNAWWNAGKVEDGITTLKDHVHMCHMHFMGPPRGCGEGHMSELNRKHGALNPVNFNNFKSEAPVGRWGLPAQEKSIQPQLQPQHLLPPPGLEDGDLPTYGHYAHGAG
ncbi:hypothetical protein NLJ89_g8392 [Agrocybe chaxingu]|uniref:Uncharacterized protein n=1 Tax=Agrocybe chaxingu TaxID=84603 RepID=A0A9W8MST2_9AGAR|nr:hypothetical protein NLJ89_g8392 [Agrocybe chaxingu]